MKTIQEKLRELKELITKEKDSNNTLKNNGLYRLIVEADALANYYPNKNNPSQ